MSLYTKKGDTGFSSTMNRMMIEKSNPVFNLLGTLDEFTSALGMARPWIPAQLMEIVRQIQNDVISLSGEIAGGPKFATRERVENLEKAIESIVKMLPQQSWPGEREALPEVTPGASEAGAALDLSRAVVRRAEREAVALSQRRGLSREIMAWLNRISDLCYVMARLADQLVPQSSRNAVHQQESVLPSKSEAVLSQTSVPAPYVSLPSLGESFCAQAAVLCSGVLRRAREMGFRAVASVCDSGGNLVCTMRDDDAFLASVDIATNKAYTSVSLKMSTKQLAPLCQPGAPLYGIQFTNGGKIVVFGGGVPLKRDGQIVGGLGVSGGSAQQDTDLADYGLELFQGGSCEE